MRKQIVTAGWISWSLVALGSSGTGCAATHPTTESEESFSIAAENEVASGSTVSARPTCSPGAARECKKTWYDRDGQIHCNVETQLCRADGYAWLSCGELDAGAVPDAGDDTSTEPDDAGAR